MRRRRQGVRAAAAPLRRTRARDDEEEGGDRAERLGVERDDALDLDNLVRVGGGGDRGGEEEDGEADDLVEEERRVLSDAMSSDGLWGAARVEAALGGVENAREVDGGARAAEPAGDVGDERQQHQHLEEDGEQGIRVG